MKNSVYKMFKDQVKEAPLETTCPLWYAGYLWIYLTERQAVEISNILIERGCPICKGARGYEVRIPSGMGIILSNIERKVENERL